MIGICDEEDGVKIRIRYFAMLREAAGREAEELEWEGAPPTLNELKSFLTRHHPDLGTLLEERPLLWAVNKEYAKPERQIVEGDEVALFPPVSGG